MNCERPEGGVEQPPNNLIHSLIEATTAAGSVAFLYCVSFWGFKDIIKEKIWEMQNGRCADPEGCSEPIYEYHHIVPENMLRRRGIKGLNVIANAIGLCFDHHKNKWDKEAAHGVFFPGVTIDEIDPKTYNGHYHEPKPPRFKRKHRRR